MAIRLTRYLMLVTALGVVACTQVGCVPTLQQDLSTFMQDLVRNLLVAIAL